MEGSVKTFSISKNSKEFECEDLALKLSLEKNILIGLCNKSSSKNVLKILGELNKSKSGKSDLDIDVGMLDNE